MIQEAECASCGNTLEIDDQDVTGRINCPECGDPMYFPVNYDSRPMVTRVIVVDPEDDTRRIIGHNGRKGV